MSQNRSENRNNNDDNNHPHFSEIRSILKLKLSNVNAKGLVVSPPIIQEISDSNGSLQLKQTFRIWDGSGRISLTLWGDQCLSDLERFDAIHLTKVYTKLNNYSHEFELYLTRESEISRIAWPNSLDLAGPDRKFLIDLKRLTHRNIPLRQTLLFDEPCIIIRDAHIIEFSLHMFGIESLPESIGGLTNCRKIILSNNHLRTLPSSLGMLNNLEELDASWNYLSDIQHIAFSKSIVSLNFAHNSLTSIPNSWASCTNLKICNLRFNPLEYIPPMISPKIFGELATSYSDQLPQAEQIGLITLDFRCDQPLPPLTYLSRNSFGYQIEKSYPTPTSHLPELHVIGIGLHLQHLGVVPSCLFLFPHLRALNLSFNNLKEIPDSLGKFPHLQNLYFQGNKWGHIPEILISILKRNYPVSIHSKELEFLVQLQLHINMVIPNRTNDWEFESKEPLHFGFIFDGEHIIALSLENQNLRQIPSEIRNLTNLKYLNLSGNLLPDSGFSLIKLPSVYYLNLDHNSLTDWSNIVSNFPNLQHLNLSFNQLSTFPKNLPSLMGLQILKLNDNELIHLSDSLFQITSLKHLNISSNGIEEIPDQIYLLKNLEFLDLSDNQLREIPISLSQVSCLSTLLIGNNHLTTYPEIAYSGPALKKLDLHNNLISKYDENLFDLNHFQLLDIRYNPIQLSYAQYQKTKDFIPQTFHTQHPTTSHNPVGHYDDVDETELNVLVCCEFLIGTPLKPLRSNAYKIAGYAAENGHVVKLSLASSRIGYIPDEILNLPFLKILNLSDNVLTKLPLKLEKLVRLESLFLSNNYIDELPYDLGYLPSLQKLDLHNNQISQLPESFEYLVHLKSLNLKDNYFSEIPFQLWGCEALESLELTLSAENIVHEGILHEGISAVRSYCHHQRFFFEILMTKLRNNDPLLEEDIKNPRLCQYATMLEQECLKTPNHTSKQLLSEIQSRCVVKLDKFDLWI